MRLEQTPRPEHSVRVSARLVTSSAILHLSADELEQTVNQEQVENPALEVAERRICLFCGSPMYDQACNVCGHFAPASQQFSEGGDTLPAKDGAIVPWAIPYDIDNY